MLTAVDLVTWAAPQLQGAQLNRGSTSSLSCLENALSATSFPPGAVLLHQVLAHAEVRCIVVSGELPESCGKVISMSFTGN